MVVISVTVLVCLFLIKSIYSEIKYQNSDKKTNTTRRLAKKSNMVFLVFFILRLIYD